LFFSIDTFEHLADPLATLSRVVSFAKIGSVVFLSVPNFNSYFSFQQLGMHPYFEYPAHLNYFTAVSLRHLVEKSGLWVLALQASTLSWEVEYISKCFPDRPFGYKLWDVMMDSYYGERLFVLAIKR